MGFEVCAVICRRKNKREITSFYRFNLNKREKLN